MRHSLEHSTYLLASILRNKLALAAVRMIILRVKFISKFLDRRFDPNEIRKKVRVSFKPLYKEVQGIWGEKYFVDINDHIGWRLYTHGYFDTTPPALGILAQSWTHGTYVDVGANIGSTSLPLAKNKIEVLGIEANPRIASDLKRNIAKNFPIPYTVAECAVGSPREISRNNTASIFSPNGNVGASSTNKHWNDSRTPSDSYTVPLSTLDMILDSHGIKHISALKIDIEGKEYEALQGFQKGFTAKPAVIFEWRPDIGKTSGKKIHDLRTLFPSDYMFLGISTRLVEPTLVEVRASAFNLEKSYENVLAAPKSLVERSEYLQILEKGGSVIIDVSSGEAR